MATLFATFSLCVCVANAVDFATVSEWKPSANNYPINMAVFADRVFLSLRPTDAAATLVSLPIADKSPKIVPFPSPDMHVGNNCSTIQLATGLDADAEGRLWVLDGGGPRCPGKLWIFSLTNGDATEVQHAFADSVVSRVFAKRELLDLVLVETEDGDWRSYVADAKSQHLVAFSLRENRSWPVRTRGMRFTTLAASPQHLFLRQFDSSHLFSLPLSELGAGSVDPTFVGAWSGTPYRMLVDRHGFLYAAFEASNSISRWNIKQPFHEDPFSQVPNLTSILPFTLAMDESGNLWLTVDRGHGVSPSFELRKALHLTDPSEARNPVQRFVSTECNEISRSMRKITILATVSTTLIALILALIYFLVHLVRIEASALSGDEGADSVIYDEVGPAADEVIYEEIN